MVHLILGGARSGKTRFAEKAVLALASEKKWQAVYIATADPQKSQQDPEMQARIARHQADRADDLWFNLETPIELGAQLASLKPLNAVIMVDCLTLWLLNVIENQTLAEQKAQLLQALTEWQGDVFLISNEIGMGVVPLDQLSRQFVDELGWLHQDLAQIADQVTLMVAGLPHSIK